MLIYKRYEFPQSIKAVADCFADVIDCEGITSAILMVADGDVTYIDVLEDDETHFLKWIKGICYELEEVEQWETPTTNL